MKTRRAGFRPAALAAAILTILAALCAGGAAAQTGATGSVGPLEQNLPRAWYRNFDYGVEVDGSNVPEAGLYQVAGKPYLLIFAPGFDPCYVLSLDAKMVRPVKRDAITPKDDDEVLLAESAFAEAEPLPYILDASTSVVFYSGQRRYRVARVPPLVGSMTLGELFEHSPIYKRNMEEYQPVAEAVAALKSVPDRIQVEVWFGTWCPHCKTLVPHFIKALQEAGNPNIDVAYHGVPPQFSSYEPAKKREIRGVPTLVFLRNGKEIGRIRGGPSSGTIEDEAAKILGQKRAAVGS